MVKFREEKDSLGKIKVDSTSCGELKHKDL